MVQHILSLFAETDAVLVKDAAFRPVAEEYATSQDAFFRDYAAAMVKLSELGSQFVPPEGIRLP